MTVLVPATQSVDNSSTTALAGGATFTGTSELNGHPDVGVSCQTDVAGTLFFDFSNDNTNWSPFPTSGFDISAGIHEFHTAIKLGRYFRVRLVNGSDAQSYLRLYTYYGTFAKATSAPLSQQLSSDSDAITVRPLADFDFEVVAGLISGYKYVAKFGRTPIGTTVDATSAPVDICDALTSSVYRGQPQGVPASISETITITSTSDQDADGNGMESAGTGMRSISVDYLDDDGLEQTLTIGLDGTNGVTTTEEVYRILTGEGVVYGSTGANVGAITITHSSTTTNVFTVIGVGRNRTNIGAYTVPANKQGILRNSVGTNVPANKQGILRYRQAGISNNAASTQEAQCAILHRPYSASADSGYQWLREITVATGTGGRPDQIPGGILFPALSDLKITLTDATASGLRATCQFDLTIF